MEENKLGCGELAGTVGREELEWILCLFRESFFFFCLFFFLAVPALGMQKFPDSRVKPEPQQQPEPQQ